VEVVSEFVRRRFEGGKETNVDGGMSAGPTSTFQDSAEGDSQYSSGHGKTQLVVSALLT
jgi:hypothetical protein